MKLAVLLAATLPWVGCQGATEAPPEQPAVTIEPSHDDEAWPATPSAKPAPTPPAPSAEALEDARDLFRAGVEAYEKGDYGAAVEHFEGAYDLSRKPQLLFNLVRAAQRDGDRATACRFFKELGSQVQAEPSLKRVADQLSNPC